jgi:DNA-binding NtrC family response regulator
MRVQEFSDAAAQLLLNYSWPGNIRELRNAVERGIALASGDRIEPVDLPKSLSASEDRPTSTSPAGFSNPEGQSLQEAELAYLKSILTANRGNVSRAAAQAGMTRQGLHKRLKKAGLEARDYRE